MNNSDGSLDTTATMNLNTLFGASAVNEGVIWPVSALSKELQRDWVLFKDILRQKGGRVVASRQNRGVDGHDDWDTKLIFHVSGLRGSAFQWDSRYAEGCFDIPAFSDWEDIFNH